MYDPLYTLDAIWRSEDEADDAEARWEAQAGDDEAATEDDIPY